MAELEEEIKVTEPQGDWTSDQWDEWAHALPEGKTKNEYFAKKDKGESFEYSSMTGAGATIDFAGDISFQEKKAAEMGKVVPSTVTPKESEISDSEIVTMDKSQIQTLNEELKRKEVEGKVETANNNEEKIDSSITNIDKIIEEINDPNFRQDLRKKAGEPIVTTTTSSPSFPTEHGTGVDADIRTTTTTTYPYEDFEEEAKDEFQQSYKAEYDKGINRDDIPEDAWIKRAKELWVENETKNTLKSRVSEEMELLEDEFDDWLFRGSKGFWTGVKNYGIVRKEIKSYFENKVDKGKERILHAENKADFIGNTFTGLISDLEKGQTEIDNLYIEVENDVATLNAVTAEWNSFIKDNPDAESYSNAQETTFNQLQSQLASAKADYNISSKWLKKKENTQLENYEQAKNSQKLFEAANARVEVLIDGAKIDTYEDIADITGRSFDNTDVAVNKFAATAASLVANLGTLERTAVAQTLEVFGVDEKRAEFISKQVVGGEATTLLIDTSRKWAEELRSEVRKGVSVSDINSLGDIGNFAIDIFSEQLFNTVITATTGPAGLVLISAGAAGGKMHEMSLEEGLPMWNPETNEMEIVEYSPLQYLMSATIAFGAEYITERVALSQFKHATNVFRKGKRIAPKASSFNLRGTKYSNTEFKVGGAIYRYGKNVNQEGFAEWSAELINNFGDKFILGKNISLTQGLNEAYVTGAFMSGAGFQVPVVVAEVRKSFASNAEVSAYKKNGLKIKTLSKRIDELATAGPVTLDKLKAIKTLEEQRDALFADNNKKVGINNQRMDDMSNVDKRRVLQIHDKKYELRSEIDNIDKNSALTKEEKDGAISQKMAEIDLLDAQKLRIISSATLTADATRESKLENQKLVESGLGDKLISVEGDKTTDTRENAIKAIEEAEIDDTFVEDYIKGKEITKEQAIEELKKSAISNIENQFKKIEEGNEMVSGFQTGTEFGLPMSIVVKESAVQGKGTVKSHERGHHGLFRKLIDGDADAFGLVDDLESYVKKRYKNAWKVFEEATETYKGESKLDVYEEKLAALTDFMRKKNLKSDLSLRGKLLGRIKKLRSGKDKASQLNEIRTGEDVFDLLLSFTSSYEKGEMSGLAAKVLKEEVGVKTTTKVKGKKSPTSLSKSDFDIRDETTDNKKKRQDTRNVAAQKIYDQYAEGKNKKEWGEFLQTTEGIEVRNEMITDYMPDMIAIAKKQGFENPMDAAFEGIDPLIKHIEAFNPSQNDNLAGYVGGYLGLKVGTGAKKVRSKSDTRSIEELKEKGRDIVDTSEDTTKETEVREGIKVIKRLGKATEKIVAKIKQQIPKDKTKQKKFVEGKTYKTQKDLAPAETQRMFGIKPKPGNLTKQDVKNAQMFIAKDPDLFISLLPKQHTTKRVKNKEGEYETRPDEATGVQNVLLNAFYNKGKRKDNLTPWTKKKNISQEDFLNVFGITKKGEQNLYKKESNTSARIKALVEQTGRLITNQTIREVIPDTPAVLAEGKSKVMFSKEQKKKIEEAKKEFENGKELERGTLYGMVKNYGFDPINMNTIEGKQKLRDNVFLGTEGKPPLIRKLPKSFVVNNMGTFANGGMYEVVINEKTKAPKQLTKAQRIRLKKNGFRIGNTESLKRFKLEDGTTILNSDPKFITKEIQLQIMPGAKNNTNNTFMFANKLQVMEYVKKAQEQAKLEGVDTFADGNINIDKALKRSSYSQLIKKGFTELFVNSQKAKRKGVKEILSLLNKEIQNDPEIYIPTIAAIFSSTSGAQGHFIRKGATIDFLNTLGLRNVEEHLSPASDFAKFVFNRMVQGTFDTYIDKALDTYQQGLLPEIYDDMLKGEGFDYRSTIPNEYKLDVLAGKIPVWIRYFNPNVNSQIRTDPKTKIKYKGINPNIIILSNGKSVAAEYGLEVDKKLSSNPNIIQTQQKLLFEIFTGKISQKTAKALLKKSIPVDQMKTKASKTNGKLLDDSGVIKTSKSLPNSEMIREAEIMDKALNVARNPNAPIKKIRVFDFDDTLARTKSKVIYITPDGAIRKISASEFARRAAELEAEGVEFDFSEFNEVIKGKKGPLLEVAKIIADKRGTDNVFVLTARPAAAATAIQEFLKSVGLDIPLKNITGLADGSPLAKSSWIVNKAAEGYNDFYFADDHTGNVQAVKKVLDQIDVKSKVQQAKTRFSKGVDRQFNDIIENKTGIEWYKEYSPVKAKTEGSSKGRFKFFIPPSAEDFVGLLYKTLGKGRVGDTQMAWYKEHLLDPFARAMENVAKDRIQLISDFKALKKALTSIPKNLRKKAFGGYTYENVIRIHIWDKQGMKVPGLSKKDLKEVNDFVANNLELEVFAEQLININKGDAYGKPGNAWLAGTITTDLINTLNTTKRSKYLEEWQENVDLIFSEKNLNKLEAAFGSNYREAMENMLTRMKTGRNRTSTGGRLENRMLDYINNSVGAVMFFNMRSAVLQTISAVNFMNWTDNNPVKAGIAFANQKQYWSDFMKLMNSDFLVDRRNGLKINVSESEIADAAKTAPNKAKGVISYLLEKGFLPTKFADSFAIASGGATFFRNRINTYVKEGMTKEEAEAKAFEDFRETAEESQQSARPDRISQQQASGLGRVILAFANTPMQYTRLIKKATQDLVSRRGDWKNNVSKIVYYGAIQNVIFNALQQAVFALAWDDEEDEKTELKKKEKYFSVANSMLDSILRGTGVGGAALSTVKNLFLDVWERSGKKRPDYADAAFKLLDFSPPIDIKISKLRQAGSNWEYNKDKIAQMGFDINNPGYLSGALVVSAITNIPVDRLMKKYENVSSAMEADQETWKRIAMMLGWPEWQLESPKEQAERREIRKEEKAEFKKEQKTKEIEEELYKGKTQKEVDRMKKSEEVYDLKKDEQVRILKSLGLSSDEIKKLKLEEDRVNKILNMRDKDSKKIDEAIKNQATYEPSKEEKEIKRIFDLNKSEQIEILEGYDLSKEEIKALKYEQDRVDKILELQED